jgi:2-polyprenyl-3-methyl-5-hydroxy-6-metoxy-1,4-benzoquinol methylase
LSFDLSRLAAYPNLKAVVAAVLDAWPEHADYCEARFRDDPPGFLRRSEDLALLVRRLTGAELPVYCADYKWMCERFLEEELFFRREGRYRLARFEQAYREVYGDPEYMRRYIHGILISQFIWTPHARAFDFFRTDFLPRLKAGTRHLEVGPGHGLFLYFAAHCPEVAGIEAWDVSDSSIAATRKALDTLGVDRDISLTKQDVLTSPERKEVFQSAIISEVLEHLEEPQRAVRSLYEALTPGGLIFVNVPINSPAPDHLYLLRTPEEARELVRGPGFTIVGEQLLPLTGYSLERALKRNLSVSCVLIGQKPAA